MLFILYHQQCEMAITNIPAWGAATDRSKCIVKHNTPLGKGIQVWCLTDFIVVNLRFKSVVVS